MLKYILFLLSEYYYEIIKEKGAGVWADIRKAAPWVEVRLQRAPEFLPKKEKLAEPLGERQNPILETPMQETLVITDLAETASQYLKEGWYVIALYHEKNRGMSFPSVKYGIEDVSALEYRTYEDVYRRLAALPWDILETERICVRESTISDVEEFYRIYRDPAITRYMEDLFPEKEAEQAYMKAYIDQIYGFYGYGLWTVVQKDSGRVIGRAGLSVREGYELVELGFVIETACQGQGYGYEACAAILEYARQELSFEKVQALVKEENQASKGLLEKLGFRFEKKVTEKNGEYELYIVFLDRHI